MKIYKVRTGWKTDFYGYTTDEEIARYFTDKEKALALYNKGAYTYKVTQITRTHKDGTQIVSETGAQYYEREKADAEPNEKVELAERHENHYTFTEIELEE